MPKQTNQAFQYEKELTLVLWVIALVGMFFLARGITGNIVLSSDNLDNIQYSSINNTGSLINKCINDKECSDNSICCIINGMGNCGSFEMCNQLKDYAKEKPLEKKKNNFDIGFGIINFISSHI